ncbi:MAG: sulfurtransferase [Acidimicrobiales bacterium]
MAINPVWAPSDLLDHLGEPSSTLIEVSFYRPDRAAYATGHIPGSRYVYWKDLLWDDLRREFPPPTVLAGRLGQLGVGGDSTLVLVGDPVQFATYAYWVLVMSGLATRATVLDGGHATWAQRGYPLTNDVPVTTSRVIVPSTPVTPERELRIGRDEGRAGLGRETRGTRFAFARGVRGRARGPAQCALRSRRRAGRPHSRGATPAPGAARRQTDSFVPARSSPRPSPPWACRPTGKS